MTVLEKEIEHALVEGVRALGGLCLKWVCPGWAGVPDRIILLPGRRIGFAEIKTTGEKPRALQMRRKRQLEKLGFRVFVLDSPNQIERIIDEIQTS